MKLRLPECASLCLLLAFLVSACGDTSPTAPAAPSAAAKMTAEPNAIVPEFLSGVGCFDRFRPFGGRVAIVFHSEHDFTIRQLAFEFVDEFGGRAAPLVSSAAAPSASVPFGVPVPTPGAAPTASTIPFPSSPSVPAPAFGFGVAQTRTLLRFDPLFVQAGTHTLPLFLHFGCGVPASGILFIHIEIGGSDATSLRVPVKA